MATKFPIIENAKRQARMLFVGIAIPHQPSVADGVYTPIRSEKILKFNRKALGKVGKVKKVKSNPRFNGGKDTMIIPVGLPGSRERVEAMRTQYEAVESLKEEVSIFSWEGDE
jgi:hypothetical protein